jgi:hypothetical protein
MPNRVYEIFIFTWVPNVKQWKCDKYNGGVCDVVCIAGMVEGSGSMARIIIVIINGTDNAGYFKLVVNKIVKLIWQRAPITK